MGRPRRPVRLPDDIDSCAALAGELLATADALRAALPTTRTSEAAHLARDAAALGAALADFTACVRRLRLDERDERDDREGLDDRSSDLVDLLRPVSPAEPPPANAREHRTATEMGKARSRLRSAAIDVARQTGR